jgi:protein gp37
MGQTSIEWTDRTVQPGIYGCTIASEACRHCYAAIMARRQEFMAAARGEVSPYAGTTRKVDGVVQFNGVVKTDATRIGPAFAALPSATPSPARTSRTRRP